MNITDNNKRAAACRTAYDPVRKRLLAEFAWGFAQKRATLVQDATVPDWGFGGSYGLPVDFLSLTEVYNRGTYEANIEGRFLVTDMTTVKIRYTADIEDTGLFDALFAEYLSTVIAFEIVEELTQSNTKKDMIFNQMKTLGKKARSIYSRQKSSRKLETTSWVKERY
jgi:hypothetical protein